MREWPLVVRITGSLLLVPVIALFALPSGSLEEYVSHTSAKDNPLILLLLEKASLTDTLAIARGLAARQDPFIGDIVESLIFHFHREKSSESEIFLRIVLEGVFGGDLSPQVLRKKTAINRKALETAFEDLQSFHYPQLKKALLLLLPYLEKTAAIKVLQKEADYLMTVLQEQDGYWTADVEDEALAFLKAVAPLQTPFLRERVLSLYELAKSAPFAHEARTLLK